MGMTMTLVKGCPGINHCGSLQASTLSLTLTLGVVRPLKRSKVQLTKTLLLTVANIGNVDRKILVNVQADATPFGRQLQGNDNDGDCDDGCNCMAAAVAHMDAE